MTGSLAAEALYCVAGSTEQPITITAGPTHGLATHSCKGNLLAADPPSCVAGSTGQPSTSQPAAVLRHSTSAPHARAFGRQLPAGQPTTCTSPQTAADVHIGPVSAAETRSHQQQQQQSQQAKFVKAKHFSGAKAGYVFKKGGKGVGYYLDPSSSGRVNLSGQQPTQSNRQTPAAAESSQDVPGSVDDSVTRQDEAEDMQPVSGELSCYCPLSFLTLKIVTTKTHALSLGSGICDASQSLSR